MYLNKDERDLLRQYIQGDADARINLAVEICEYLRRRAPRNICSQTQESADTYGTYDLHDYEQVEQCRSAVGALSEILGITPNRDEFIREVKHLLTFDVCCPHLSEETKQFWGYEPEAGTPFFSESFLYPIFGKEEARTILALLHSTLEKAGISREEQYRIQQ